MCVTHLVCVLTTLEERHMRELTTEELDIVVGGKPIVVDF